MHTDRSFACSRTHLTVERARLRLMRSLLLQTTHKSCEAHLCRILRRCRLPPGTWLEASPCYLKPPPAVATRRSATSAAAAFFAAAAAAACCFWQLLPPLTAAAAVSAGCCCSGVAAEVPVQGKQGAKASLSWSQQCAASKKQARNRTRRAMPRRVANGMWGKFLMRILESLLSKA